MARSQNSGSGKPSWREKDQRWQFPVQKNGKRKFFYSSTPGRAGMIECRKKAEKWLSMNQPDGNPLVRDLFADWLEEVRANVSEDAYGIHESHGRLYILPEIGGFRVQSINNEQMLQRIINKAFKNSASGKPLAKKTLENLRKTITQFVKFCRKSGYITLVPEELAIPHKAHKTEKHILQPNDIKILFTSDETTPAGRGRPPRHEWFIHAFRFAVLMGVRPGELLGLRWTDIREGVVHIRRSVNRRGKITTGKNENAQRDFVLPAQAVKEIDEQRQMLKEAGVNSQYVFSDEKGEPPSQNRLLKHLASYCRWNGITKVTPYELRHTFYSINKTLPAEYIKRVGGHSESMDTFGVYGHDVEGELELAAALLEKNMNAILD